LPAAAAAECTTHRAASSAVAEKHSKYGERPVEGVEAAGETDAEGPGTSQAQGSVAEKRKMFLFK